MSAIPENARRPLDRLQAEATSDPSREPTTVELAGREITVLPLRKWRTSGIAALRQGDFETWAHKCLDPESLHVWVEIDPDIDDVEAMFDQWSAITGQSPGESFASRR